MPIRLHSEVEMWKLRYEAMMQERNSAWDKNHQAALQYSKLCQEMGELRNELASVKRPEPKFKVEQIVISTYNGYESSFWIHGLMWSQHESTRDWGWFYTQQRKDTFDRRWVPEAQLRKQTFEQQTGIVTP